MADKARSDDSAVQAQLDRLDRLFPGGDSLGLERILVSAERGGGRDAQRLQRTEPRDQGIGHAGELFRPR